MKNETPLGARGKGGGSGAEFWRGQTDAVVLLREVDMLVESMRQAGSDVRGFDPYIVDWHRAVFSVEAHWQQGHNRAAIAPEPLAALRSLALVLDLTRAPSPAVIASASQLRDLVREARDLVGANADALGKAELQYVYSLLQGVDDLLSEVSALGGVDLREHLDRLNGALVSVAAALAAEGHGETGQKIWSVALRIVGTYRGLLNDAGQWAAITGVTLTQLSQAKGH